jgi:hypothetical protein
LIVRERLIQQAVEDLKVANASDKTTSFYVERAEMASLMLDLTDEQLLRSALLRIQIKTANA